MSQVWIGRVDAARGELVGQVVEEAQARISPLDRGFLLGDAVFETVRVYEGRPHAVEEHVLRLRSSCRETRIPFPEGIETALAAVIAANRLADCSARITVSRGPGGRGTSPQGAGPATVVIVVAPVHHRPEIYAQGLRLATARRRRIADASLSSTIKSTNYLVHVLARIEAEEAGADDALFVDDDGLVVEATQANVFAIFGDELVTPPLVAGCLPGVTRAAVLALAPALGLVPVERPIPVAALDEAREVLLTASLLEVAPVVALDGRALSGGKPGPLTARLHQLYRQHAQSNGRSR